MNRSVITQTPDEDSADKGTFNDGVSFSTPATHAASENSLIVDDTPAKKSKEAWEEVAHEEYERSTLAPKKNGSAMKVSTQDESVRQRWSMKKRSTRRTSSLPKRLSMIRQSIVLRGRKSTATDKLNMSCPTTEAEKRVAFGEVRAREYDTVLGSNPSVSRGVAVELGGSYLEAPPVAVEEYEATKGSPRSGKDLQLSVVDKKERLRRSGYSHSEIQKATAEINRTKRRRKKTVENLKFASVEEAMEGAVRKVRHATSLRWIKAANKQRQ